MNKRISLNVNSVFCFALLCLALLFGGCTLSPLVEFKNEGNPLIRHIYTADPSARVFGDKLYLYTSHDRDGTDNNAHFDMTDWHVFSTSDLNSWVDHGAFFSLDDVSWASKQAWAPDAVERNGKYYFYYPVEQAKIGVAVSDSPTSGFVDPLGKPLIDKTGNEQLIGNEPIDPAILIDDDGQSYLYFGCRDARVVKLKDNMIELGGDIQPLQINGIEHFTEKTGGGWYGEGPWIFKRGDYYYYMYSNGWEKNTTLVYAMATNPLGPFDYVGEVMTPVGAGTSHGSITEFNNKWYVFYHSKLLSKNSKQRSVHFDEIQFDKRGKIIPLIYQQPKL
ncbi:family 43 glycosylhydrolase [Colwellia sp. 12G3]|uniref:family 43 glycosylhydrolase n=1 Tax=Colwellia sp. 12G3 TaxID=2058299 RepID=UPI000C32B38B|nr:family 43 glycosylhydrolase [Colwellia sp. 12G3]PKI16702.1 glycosyl hydrolase [Colwellia sp. 12G3]